VPFYRRAGSNLADFPIVSKAIVLSQLENFIAEDSGCDRAKLAKFLRFPHPQTEHELHFDRRIVVEQTSGSSGIPFRIPKTVGERIRASFGIWRVRQSIDPQCRQTNFLALIHHPLSALMPNSFEELWMMLEKKAIRWLHANPVILKTLSGYIAASNRPLPASLRYIESSGSHLPPEIKAEFESRTGITVLDQYGCRETWAIAYRRVGAFVPVRENVEVEIVDDSGNPVDSIGAVGRVVVTSRYQRLFPFIRYDTGDIAKLVGSNDQSAIEILPYRPYHLILGAKQRIMGTELFRFILMGVYKSIGYKEVKFLQFRQLTGLDFLMIADASPDAERIRKCVEVEFNGRKVFERPVRIHLCTVSTDENLIRDAKDCLFTNKDYVPGAVEPRFPEGMRPQSAPANSRIAG
jgi:phenylacetate-CoA ligase